MTIVKLSIQSWSQEQKFAVARVTTQALTQSAPILGESWSCQCWYDLLSYLNVSQKDLESRKSVSYREAVALISNEKRDIRIEVLLDILALALHITNIEEDKKKDVVMLYDARSRRFLVELEHLLNLSRGDLTAVENSVAQQMYYALLECQDKIEKKHGGESSAKAIMQQNMDISAQKALMDSNKKKNAFRWIATGAGIIGGGAVIGKVIKNI